MQRLIFQLLAIAWLLPSLPSISHGAPEAPRNIVFILIDDQRYDFLGFKNHPWLETPNIDRLAEKSVYFDRAYVTTSLCSPSRASIITGQYAHTHRVVDNDTPAPSGTPTFPILLQQNGYRTGFVGKWHMGGSNDQPRPGFDYWASFKGQGPYENPTINIDGQAVPKSGYTPDILTDLASAFIKKQAENDGPYCLFLSHKSIHEPFTPAPRHRGRFKDLVIPRPKSFADTEENYQGKPSWLRHQRKSWHGAERDFSIQDYGDFDRFFRLYSECMLGVDESVGSIVSTLEELGQLEDTVIIYFSDNGYLMGEHGLIDKRVMYEESIRVPCFVHCPAMIEKPKVRNEFVLNIDIAPTILDLAGITAPPTMHGVSFLPLVTGENKDWRKAFVYEYFADPNAVQTPTIFGLRTQRYSYMTYHGVWDRYELYDMENDPQQRHNLLGDISFGQNYGTFMRHLQRQDHPLYQLVKPLDDQLTSILKTTNGTRLPIWTSDHPSISH